MNREFVLWSEDANDGEFAIWRKDDFIAALAAIGPLLSDAPAPRVGLEEAASLLAEWMTYTGLRQRAFDPDLDPDDDEYESGRSLVRRTDALLAAYRPFSVAAADERGDVPMNLTRPPRPGEYADPQPAAVDIAGDERTTRIQVRDRLAEYTRALEPQVTTDGIARFVHAEWVEPLQARIAELEAALASVAAAERTTE